MHLLEDTQPDMALVQGDTTTVFHRGAVLFLSRDSGGPRGSGAANREYAIAVP